MLRILIADREFGVHVLAGEVVSTDQAAKRSAVYHQEEQSHTYFMNLRYSKVVLLYCSRAFSCRQWSIHIAS